MPDMADDETRPEQAQDHDEHPAPEPAQDRDEGPDGLPAQDDGSDPDDGVGAFTSPDVDVPLEVAPDEDGE